MTIPFHRYAEMFNLIAGAEFAELVEDVRRHGVRERIVILDDQVLDGRNRYLAAIAAGLLSDDDLPADRPGFFQRFVPDVDGDPLSFVISKNIHRRHLTTAQRAYAMAEFETFRHGGARRAVQDANLPLETRPPETRGELAERAHVSERSITSAAAVRDHGAPELKDAVKQGDLAISAAEKIARLPVDEQPAAVARALPNGARAIMGSRTEPDDSLDYSPTPPWATRALIEQVLPAMRVSKATLATQAAWEPACGEGHMAEVLMEYFGDVEATDVHDYGYGDYTQDFLTASGPHPFDWIITNPPFKEKAEQFALKAIEQAKLGVAIFARLQWLETIGRYERLFRDHPPTQLAIFTERVPLCMGRWEPDGGTATAYIWLVWIKGRSPRPPFWIPPDPDKALWRPDDIERFTAHPVIKKEHPKDSAGAPLAHDGSGEVIEPKDDQLDIPAFLRRSSSPVVSPRPSNLVGAGETG